MEHYARPPKDESQIRPLPGMSAPRGPPPAIPYSSQRKAAPDFWQGPYGVLVPAHVTSVPYNDGANMIYQNGNITDVHVPSFKRMDEKIYKALYTEQGRDGKWYYDPRKSFRATFSHH